MYEIVFQEYFGVFIAWPLVTMGASLVFHLLYTCIRYLVTGDISDMQNPQEYIKDHPVCAFVVRASQVSITLWLATCVCLSVFLLVT